MLQPVCSLKNMLVIPWNVENKECNENAINGDIIRKSGSIIRKIKPLGIKYFVISPTVTIGSTVTVIFDALSSRIWYNGIGI